MDEKEAILVLTAEAEGNARRSSVGSRDRRCWERTRAAGEVLIEALRKAMAVIRPAMPMGMSATFPDRDGKVYSPEMIEKAREVMEVTGVVEAAPAKSSDDTYGPLHKARPEKFPTRIDEE